MDEETLSASLEDYLEAIYHIVKEKQAAKAKDISLRMDVNSSSVTGALRALSKRGLVNYAPYDLITLTQDGEKTAKTVVYKHKALLNFFKTVFCVDDKEAEENACKIEHVISPTVLDRFIKYSEYVETCSAIGTEWVEGKGFVCKEQ